jgi:hypothetical protein
MVHQVDIREKGGARSPAAVRAILPAECLAATKQSNKTLARENYPFLIPLSLCIYLPFNIASIWLYL